MNKATVYGIPNCDTIKKTITWMKKHDIDFNFHDFKKEGISISLLTTWCKKTGWEQLLNKKSATWRGLSKHHQSKIINQQEAIKCMIEQSSIIKRPVIDISGTIIVGFDEEVLSKIFLIR